MARRSRKPNYRDLLQKLRTRPRGKLTPALSGFAYRFTLLLPLLRDGREVFPAEDLALLNTLFEEWFEGYLTTSTKGGLPAYFGAWKPPEAAESVIDEHTLYVVYTAQAEEATAFFQYLRSILELKEDVVVMERLAVTHVPAGDLSDLT